MESGQNWPHCRLCKAQMVFFFQMDISKECDIPLKPESHLLVFMCPTHNDVPSTMLEPGDNRLPPDYFNQDFGHYRLILNKPSNREVKLDNEPRLLATALKHISGDEQIDWDGKVERGTSGFKLGGVPLWCAEPEFPACACGADMTFICQVPPQFEFPKASDAPAQPDAVSPLAYSLFLGRSIFLFACRNQCTPFSLYAIAQEKAEEE